MSESADIPEGYKVTELGVLPEEWQIVTITDIAEKMRAGGTPSRKKPEYWGGDIPFVLIEDMTAINLFIDKTKETINENGLQNSSAWIVPQNSLLLSMYATIGATAINTIPMATNQAILAIIPKSNFDIMFGAYSLQFYSQRLASQNVQSTQKNVNKGIVSSFKIPLPPLPEQHAIATTLRTVQEAKEKTDGVIAATKGFKVAMMKHLFTYGPVPPDEAERVVLKETEIGMVPEGWDVKKIGDVSIFQPGYAFKSEDYVDSGVKLFKISNVSFGITNWDDVSYLPSSYLDEFKQYQLKIGDLVIAMTRPIVQGGIKISRISSNDCPSLLNQRVGRFIPKSTINLDFLYQSLFNNSFINAIGDGAGGSQQPNISGKQIERILIPVPSIEIQNHIATILSSLDQKLAAEQSRKEALDTLFTSLLHDLMTAKIRVGFEGTPATKTSV
ncbi:MAG: restriction endonuclease subunit S [Methanoregula sp.]|nr:restriction endonuclease subunit S [Methanoregula sp.]